MDNSTVNDLLTGRVSQFNIDYSIGLDTQTLSYLEPFSNGRNISKLSTDIKEIFDFISQPNVRIDCLPYQYENMYNIKNKSEDDKCRIFDKLRSYEILRNLDYDEFRNSGHIHPTVNESQIQIGTDSIFRKIINPNKEFNQFIEGFEKLYLFLLKIAHIELFYKYKHPIEKLKLFLDFLNDEVGILITKKSAFAYSFFKDRNNHKFFSRVQKGHKNLLDVIKNMAWDLFHLRCLESNMLIQGHQNAKHFFSALLTYDKDLIELSKLITIKAIVINKKTGEIFPFFDNEKLGNEFNDTIQEYDTQTKRKEGGITFSKANHLELTSILEKALLLCLCP